MYILMNGANRSATPRFKGRDPTETDSNFDNSQVANYIVHRSTPDAVVTEASV